MSEPMEQVRTEVLTVVRKTDLPPLPGDGSEPFGIAMRHVLVYLDDGVKALVEKLREFQERLTERETELASLRAEASLQADQADAWRQQMAGLRAIVARLPKTADGVPVVPGQMVWATLDGAIEEVEIQRPGKRGTYVGCYSTHEAAEAARKEAADV